MFLFKDLWTEVIIYVFNLLNKRRVALWPAGRVCRSLLVDLLFPHGRLEHGLYSGQQTHPHLMDSWWQKMSTIQRCHIYLDVILPSKQFLATKVLLQHWNHIKPYTPSLYSFWINAGATYVLTLCRPMMKATLRLQGLMKLDQLVSKVMWSPFWQRKRTGECSNGDCPAYFNTTQSMMRKKNEDKWDTEFVTAYYTGRSLGFS